MKNIMYFLRRIFIGGFLLYGYNLIAYKFNLIIPINIFSILIVALLGAPGLFALVLFKVSII